ncbi:MAG: PAS domain S-box protein [Ramlibacter sp.]
MTESRRTASDAEYAIRLSRTAPPEEGGEDELTRLRQLLDATSDAVMLVDNETKTYVDVNRAAGELLGYEREAMMALGPTGRPELGPQWRQHIDTTYNMLIARSPQAITTEEVFRHRDGTEVPVDVTRHALRIGGRWLIFVTARDISERKATQERLLLFQAAMDNSPDALIIVDRETMRYAGANLTAVTLAGQTREQFLALDPHSHSWPGATRSDLEAKYDTLIAVSPQPRASIESRNRPDGSSFPAEVIRVALKIRSRWVILLSIRDITERQAATQRLERLLAAMNEAADAIQVIDPQSMTFEDVNEAAARLFGLSRQQMLEMGPVQVSRAVGKASPQDVRARHEEAIARYPESVSSMGELSIGGGAFRTVEFSRRALRVQDRWLIVSVGRDVTERIAGQRRLLQLEAAVNQATDMVLVIDPEAMEYVEINEATARNYGLPRELIMERGMKWTLQHTKAWMSADESTTASARHSHASDVDDIIEGLRQRYHQLIDQYPASMSERRKQSIEGQPERIFEATQRAFQMDGQWLIISVNRDITERRAAERRLERVVAAFNESIDGVIVIDPAAMKYVDVNEAASRLFGVSRQDMLRLGPVGTEAMGLRSEVALRERYQRLIEMHPLAETGTRPFRGPGHPERIIEYGRRAVKVDGQWLIVTVGRDVTERMATQRRLEQLRAAVNQASDMVLVIDPKAMTFVEINEAAAREYGLTREAMMEHGVEWVTRHVNSWTSERLAAHYAELIDQFPESSTVVSTTDIEGMPAKVIETTRRALQMEGQWLIISVGRNVTERVRAERELHERMKELARSNRDLEQFAYVTSHDLSEPLRMVASYTQLLARRYSTHFDEDGKEFMGYIVTGAQRMKQLIDDLLAYSRAGRAGTELREWPLDKVLDDALENLAHAIHESNARIEREAHLPKLACDRTGMIQVFQNLIANSLKFKGEAPVVIRIDSAHDETGWIFSVTDNGIGIASEYFERIFVIFQRLHGRTAFEGTGIGLSICKKIIERHGGTIWVESTPGRGATFKFRLPGHPTLPA